MFKNYIKTALRNISRNKAYSFLNILGLAVGMAAFILILLHVQFELSFAGEKGTVPFFPGECHCEAQSAVAISTC